ncbi:hypothetical protein AB0H49_33835 [Nocardia sp. NPDC050713]|uniref:hypothetical protein n=1 Tax=Nocardia sp. NPDC050713 TaxID=3154511 RepID=UPI0033E2F6C0
MRRTIWRGLQAAHLRALAAHKGLGLASNDGYGLIWLVQHEELGFAVEEVIPDMRRIKPARARYELIVVGEANIILYPWKFADDAYTAVAMAKMTMSELRKNLLALAEKASDQLTIDQAHLTQEELDAEVEELDTFLTDAVEAGRLVIIAYAANPHSGVLRIYWGEASQADDQGRLKWSDIEQIPAPADTGGDEVPLRPAGPILVPDPKPAAGPRFDQPPMAEIPLAHRNPLTTPDGGQPPAPQPETASDD